MSSRKYKILAFCPYYPPHIGGLEKYAEELHQHLANNGHKVTVITPDIPAQKEYPTYPGVQVRRFPALDIVYGFPFPKLWVKSFWTIFFGVCHTYGVAVSGESPVTAVVFLRARSYEILRA